MIRLIDTNILVYAFDPRDEVKRTIATGVLYDGARRYVVPHQVLLEFFIAVTKPLRDLGGQSLMSRKMAIERIERFQRQFIILWPDADVLTAALNGVIKYGLSWYDAHLLAYAQVNDVSEILSEDFQHGRHYGRVRVVNPFLAGVQDLPPLYDTATS